jgi:hypothetical protein
LIKQLSGKYKMKKYYLIGAVMHKYLSAVYISFFLLVVSGWSNVGFAHEGHGEVIQGAPTAMPNRPSASRVSQADRYEQLNVRMDRLRTQDCQKQYFLHKAQAWLNISREFYHEGDGAAAVDAAFGEALAIVESLEKGLLPSVETKLIQNADKVRPDLWVMASERKVNSGSSCCAIKETAYCEVALVRAGHAQANLGGIARTQPLIGMAQDLCTTAKEAKCVVASVVMQTPQAVSTPATTSPAVAIAPRDAAKTEPKLAIKQTPVIQISYSADAFFEARSRLLNC